MFDILQHYSYLGLFAILFVEEGGIPLPIPGDIFIAAAAALPNSNYFLVVATVILATLSGSTILFTLSRTFGHKLLTKYSKHLKITPGKIKKVDVWFKKHGGKTIVIGRLIPGIRTITPFTAGLFGVSYKTFWLYSAVAAFVWANIYYAVGRLFGNLLSTIIN